MNKFMTVFKFQLKEGISSKTFLVTAFILFALILGFFGVTHFVNDEEEKIEVSVLNQTEHYPLTEEELNKQYDLANFTFITEDELEKKKELIEEGEVDEIFVITEKENKPVMDYFYERTPDMQLMAFLQSTLKTQHTAYIGETHQLEAELMQSLMEPIEVVNNPLKVDETQGLIYFFIYLIFIFIIMFGQMVAMGVAGEKSTRVMEIMITKVKPITMMYAKVLSSMILGVTQVLIVVGGFLVARLLGWTNGEDLSLFGMPMDLSVLNAKIFLFFALFFALGYILYAILFAAIASAANRVEDINSTITPVNLLLTAGFLLGFMAMFEPTDKFVLIGTYIPFFSPIVAFTRVILGEITTMEIVASISILVVTIAVISYFANRIYLNGVMKYDNKTTFKDILKMAKK